VTREYYRPTIIIEEYDGCPMRDLTVPLMTYDEWVRAVKTLMRRGFKFEELGMKSVESGRAMSWSWPPRG